MLKVVQENIEANENRGVGAGGVAVGSLLDELVRDAARAMITPAILNHGGYYPPLPGPQTP